jgi:hypothetical protein
MKNLYRSLLLALALTGTSFAQVPSTNDTSDQTTHNTGGGTEALRPGTGSHNTAYGWQTLHSNTSGSYNVSFGELAAQSNTTGSYNTAIGFWALYANQVGVENTAVGEKALNLNRVGFNTAVGFQSLIGSTHGKYNIALGWNAGRFVSAGSDNIEIGNQGDESGDDNDTIRIGTEGTHTNTYIAGIANNTTVSGPYVVIDSATGQLGVSTTPPAAAVTTAYVPGLLREMRQQAAEIRGLKQQQLRMQQQMTELKTLNEATRVALQKLQAKDEMIAQR